MFLLIFEELEDLVYSLVERGLQVLPRQIVGPRLGHPKSLLVVFEVHLLYLLVLSDHSEATTGRHVVGLFAFHMRTEDQQALLDDSLFRVPEGHHLVRGVRGTGLLLVLRLAIFDELRRLLLDLLEEPLNGFPYFSGCATRVNIVVLFLTMVTRPRSMMATAELGRLGMRPLTTLPVPIASRNSMIRGSLWLFSFQNFAGSLRPCSI